jgi:transketolase
MQVGEHERWQELGQQLRVDSIRAAAAAGSGHPTSSMSAADLMAVLLSKFLRYDFNRPAEPGNDHLIFSKGHASPLLYSMYKAAGVVSDAELLSFRKLGSRLEGHPTPKIPWVDVATGSLGRDGFHGKPLDDPEAAIRELGGLRELTVQPNGPDSGAQPHQFPTEEAAAASWKVGEEVATRRAFGDALAALGASNGRIVALDGEVGNSTYTGIFGEAHPDRYFEMYIAEQQLIATAVGFQVRGWVPFAATFAAFMSRAYDFIRMAAISRADIRLVGSHCGVSIGQDGPSQMGLEDIAALRAVHGSTVLYPSCANQTAKLIEAMVDQSGVSYLRTTRASLPVLYPADEDFRIGGSRVLRSSDTDQVTLVAAGVTLHEALAAADTLAAEEVAVRVIDLYSVKPIDGQTLIDAAEATGVIVTVEDHHPEGGIGEAVLEVFVDTHSRPRISTLAVRNMPTSGAPAELLTQAGIDRVQIAETARSLVGRRATSG